MVLNEYALRLLNRFTDVKTFSLDPKRHKETTDKSVKLQQAKREDQVFRNPVSFAKLSSVRWTYPIAMVYSINFNN